MLTTVFTRLFVSQSKKVQFVKACREQSARQADHSTHQAYTREACFSCQWRSLMAPKEHMHSRTLHQACLQSPASTGLHMFGGA